ncbi:MAG: hypothetical protein HGA33_05170 [Candidatus Moranbacteria bacterium]|nr:hypothetical protein [Candidatus Moranbacteria bacterium]
MAKVTKEELVRENARLTDENRRLRSERDFGSKRAGDALGKLIDQFCIEFGLRENTSYQSTRGIFAYVGRVIGERNMLRDERAWLREMLGQTTEKEFQSDVRARITLKEMDRVDVSNEGMMKYPR